MHSDELAANVDPITRQYISLAIQEAMVPALNEIWDRLSRQTDKPPPPAIDQAQLVTVISDNLAPAINALITSRITTLNATLSDTIAQANQTADDANRAVAKLREDLDILDQRLTGYINADRYAITRAQVIKAMKEAND